MMYFSESDPGSCDKPLELNQQFEAAHDTKEYEVKISNLLSHAQDRLTREEPAKMRTWDEAVATLRQGDHYLLILLNVGSTWNAVLKHAWKTLTQRRSQFESFNEPEMRRCWIDQAGVRTYDSFRLSELSFERSSGR
jgi:hypothetical protein